MLRGLLILRQDRRQHPWLGVTAHHRVSGDGRRSIA
jgi:hypothetical protein